MISIRSSFISLLILSACAAGNAESRISVAFDADGLPINRDLFGANQISYPNLKNITTGGISPAHDRGFGIWDPEKHRPVPEMVALSREAGIRVQRFPGGCASHFFDWKKMIGPTEERPNQQFGLPEFLKFCEAAASTPILTLPDYAGNAQDAADLVEYLNAPDDGTHPWAAQRSADGRSEPWNVFLFECGNETYHGNHREGAAARTLSAEEYAARYQDFRRAMRTVDPRIRLGAVWHTGEWNRVLLEKNSGAVDFIAPHIYVGGYSGNDGNPAPEEFFRIMLAGVRRVSGDLEDFRAELAAAGADSVPMAIPEFICHFTQEKPAPYRLSLGGALIFAEILRQFLYAPDLMLANYWQFANEYWGMIRNYQEPYLKRPAYHVQDMFRRYLLDELFTPQIETGRFNAPGGYGVPRADDNHPAGGTETSDNLLSQQRWHFTPVPEEKIRQRELPDGTLEVTFLSTEDINYYHAAKFMDAYPLYGYKLTAEVRVEGLSNSSGAALQIGDGRGFNATRSCAATPGVRNTQWTRVETVYTPLADTKNLIIQARRMSGNSSGTMWIRNLRVELTQPENIGSSPLLEATVSRSADKRKISFLIVNKSMHTPEKTFLAISGVRSASAETLTADSIIATNENAPENVTPRPLPLHISSDGVKVELPPHSLSGISIEL